MPPHAPAAAENRSEKCARVTLNKLTDAIDTAVSQNLPKIFFLSHTQLNLCENDSRACL
jgi:hypothetical protein